MNVVENIVQSLQNCDITQAIESFIVEQNDEITNGVREQLDQLSQEKIKKIKEFLNHSLNLCYDGNLFDEENVKDNDLISSLSKNELFLFKENVIYFLGRLSIDPDVEILQKAYFAEDNKYAKLNLVFASLCTFDETIEMDFAEKCRPGSEYDEMIRSWTMAYFTMTDNPYQYVDTADSDWTKAKIPRIKRLDINDPANPKYKKAMSFRLLDLLVLYLFQENRNLSSITAEEKEIIENSDIQYEKYSSKKKQLMKKLKDDILNK